MVAPSNISEPIALSKGSKPRQKFADGLAQWIAVAGGLGHIPEAPGTCGSVPGIALGWSLLMAWDACRRNYAWEWVALGAAGTWIVLIAIALWSIHRTEQLWGKHDDGRIVVDEVLGAALAVLATPATPLWLLGGFVVFRLLDIAKPGPIGWADRKVPGAVGTLVDDLIAGGMSAIFLGACWALGGGSYLANWP